MDIALRQPNFADIFEQLLVPAIFERYARDLVERARPIGPSDRILDLGCGTGIVARVLRERLGGAARISGADINALMVAKAKSLTPEVDFHEANAMALPFADGSFDLVIGQQLLQFVPDRAAALREARRVLAPGGRLVLSTWRSRAMQPLHHALCTLAEQHLGPGNDKRYSLDGEELRELVAAAGFRDLRLEVASLTEQYKEFPVRMNAMGAGIDMGALPEAERERRLASAEAAAVPILASFTKDGMISAPSFTNVITAVA